MRSKNSFLNMQIGFWGQIITLIIGFISRTVFINYLGVEYLGINGLFVNILTLLSLANLGIGTALSYSLYKPIADGNINKVAYLNNLLRKVYKIIGIIIFCLGLIALPFIDVFLKGGTDIDNIELIYLIFLLNYIFPYLFGLSYRSVVTAHQREYIYLTANFISILLMNIFQIFALVLTENFILYLAIQSISNVGTYTYLRFKALKLYPYLSNKSKVILNSGEKEKIRKNIKGSIYQNFGFVASNGIDNILIASFIGITQVGLYANYNFLILAVQSLVKQLFTTLVASLGNLNAINSNKQKNIEIFNAVYFSNFWVIGISSICLYVLLNPFITMWIGDSYLLEDSTVFLIVLTFYVAGIQTTSNVFRNAHGLFWQGRFRPILAALLNLIISISLVDLLGLNGIFLGTILSILLISFWYDPLIIFKYGLKTKVEKYFAKYIIYFLTTVASGYITLEITSVVTYQGVIGFGLKLFICMIISNILFLLLFKRQKEFDFIVSRIVSLIMKKTKSKVL